MAIKKWGLLLLSLCLIWGCQKKAERMSEPKILTLNLQEGNPPTLHPQHGIDLRSRCLFLNLYEPLMRRDGEGKLVYAAAEKVEVDPDGTRYTFHLRPHCWSNGEPVTAYHFEKAWKYALSPSSFCVRADLFYPIKNAEKAKKAEVSLEEVGIEAPDEKTLIVQLQHPTSYFLDLTATSFFSPLYEPTSDEPKFFNGPFAVGDWVHDLKLSFLPNPYYWDRSSIDVDEVRFTFVRDPMTALAMYEKGELDLVGDPFSSLPFDSIPAMENQEMQSKVISRIFYLLVNSNSFPMHNTHLRRALSLSIDREAVTQHLFFGEIPTLSLLPKPLSLLEEKDLAPFLEDPAMLFEKALEELNLTRATFPRIVLNYAELSGQKKLAEFLQEQWKEKLGIETDIVCSEWNVHIANLRKKNYQIGTLHLTTLFQDPMFYFDLFKDRESHSNYAAWEDPSFRSLLVETESLIDKSTRDENLKELELQLFKEMPVIPLFTQNLQYLVKDEVDLAVSDLGIYDFKSTKIR